MKFTVKQDDLQEALVKAKGTLACNDTRVVLKNFAIKAKGETISIVSTDLDLAIVCETKAEVEREGVTTIPGVQFLGIVQKAGAFDIELDVDTETLQATIKSGRFEATLMCISAEDFPSIQEFPEEAQSIEREPFLKTLNRISFSICDNEARKNLLNVKVDGHSVMASDGHVTTVAQMDAEIKDVLIPSLAVRELVRIIRRSTADKLEIGQTDSFLMFRLDKDVFITRLSTGKFPDIHKRALKPTEKNDIFFEVDRIALRDAVARVACTASERSRAVKFKLCETDLSLSSFDRGGNSSIEVLDMKYGRISGEDVVDCEPMEVLFDYQYINDVLGSMAEDNVKFRMASNIRVPVRLDEKDFTVLLMRLSDTVLKEAADDEAAKTPGSEESVDEI